MNTTQFVDGMRLDFSYKVPSVTRNTTFDTCMVRFAQPQRMLADVRIVRDIDTRPNWIVRANWYDHGYQSQQSEPMTLTSAIATARQYLDRYAKESPIA